MSADLFAAFGMPKSKQQPKETRAKDTTVPGTSTAVPEELPWILQSKPLPKTLRDEPTKPLWKQDGKGTDVLFDASDDENEDDFGDFEEAPTVTKSQPATQPLHNEQQQHNTTTDLLGLDDFLDMQISQPSNSVPEVGSNHNLADDLLGTQLPSLPQSDRVTSSNVNASDIWAYEPAASEINHGYIKHEQQPAIPEAVATDDEWGNFEEVEEEDAGETVLSSSSHKPNLTQNGREEDELPEDEDWATFEDQVSPSKSDTQPPTPANASRTTPSITTTTKPQPQPTPTPTPPQQLSSTPQPRPTNIPPPSTLLQLLPKLYHSLSTQSQSPSHSQPSSLSPSPLPHQILQLYTTTARIISGRPHRWKRDPFLSQSTRISQAGLKSTGMKLTALDKSETIKEDQEAEEVVAAWLRHAPVLNAMMVRGKVARPPMGLSKNMAVRMGTGVGVVSAKECCAVCGLRRNERVVGIDVSVEDSFGEFWVEFWGHRDCYGFWHRYEGWLDKR